MATHHPILLLLAFSCCFSNLYAETVRKELRTKEANQDKIIRLGHSIQSNRIDPSRVIQLSWRPRVFLYRGFLSEEECDRLIFWTKSKENSIQNGGDSGKVGTSKLPRSSEISSSMNDDIEATIEERISAWTFLPKENSKPFQVLHFGLEDTKEKYDYFGNKSMLALNETLMATVILYLSNVSHGGQILFPESEVKGFLIILIDYRAPILLVQNLPGTISMAWQIVSAWVIKDIEENLFFNFQHYSRKFIRYVHEGCLIQDWEV
ncbi:probable prolyl 4-hydroxylase 12 isoform X2 [Camellia sinensis]|uniref:probable prolyl 4-hydroxylase 12 isoform X2 n=1 Tax=Camellia sinensis TaxID=4442 RepID=UPI001035EBA9|nr:probable prolyl 4-hydroxylase 12 isoform X2 [Camellia sinensis]